MVEKGVLFLIIAVFCIIGTNAVGEFRIIHSPVSLKFTGSSATFGSSLKEIYSASLGLSLDEHSEWDGLTIVDPFNTPEAAVEIYVDGVKDLGYTENSNSKGFPLSVDKYDSATYEVLTHKIKQRFHKGGNNLVNVGMSEIRELSNIFGEFPSPKVTKHVHLNPSTEEDYHFLVELNSLNAIIKKLQSGVVPVGWTPDNAIDFYYFRIRSLHDLSDFHGPNSEETKEAKKLLRDNLEQLSNALVQIYNGNILVTVVTNDVAHTRRAIRAADTARQATDANNSTSPVETQQQTRQQKADTDYPVIFNILLWFSVSFIFSLVAIIYVMVDMDPGRDSIIYRMTSSKIKKDN